MKKKKKRKKEKITFVSNSFKSIRLDKSKIVISLVNFR